MIVERQIFFQKRQNMSVKSVNKFTDYNFVTKLDSDSKLCLS